MQRTSINSNKQNCSGRAPLSSSAAQKVRGRAFASRSVLLPTRIAPPALGAEGSALVSNRSFTMALSLTHKNSKSQPGASVSLVTTNCSKRLACECKSKPVQYFAYYNNVLGADAPRRPVTFHNIKKSHKRTLAPDMVFALNKTPEKKRPQKKRPQKKRPQKKRPQRNVLKKIK